MAVDMESAWLADGVRADDAGRPLVVVRVVLDTADHELRSLHLPGNLRRAQRRLAAVIQVLEQWAAVTGPRQVVLAAPRSFCAGVERAIEIVDRALDRFQPPVYVRRQIVHNTHVVERLEGRGAVFVNEVDEVPPGAVLVFAAHGVAPEVRVQAEQRQLRVIDATCPLVAKVHSEARHFAERGFDIVLVGHADHEEVEGTVGEVPGRITVVATHDDVDRLEVDDPDRVAYLTQTTLAVGEVEEIVGHLRERYPSLVGPRREDICYATQNRQEAVAAIAADVDLVLVVGSANSSNSRRLAEVAARSGTPAHLVDGCADIQLDWLRDARVIGITAGASAPESTVDEVVAAIASLGVVTLEERRTTEEAVMFKLPVEVRS
jgi:4-hydroxy-3-methylbut-2-enyl diphosphate reductase